MVNSGKMNPNLYHNIIFNKFKKHFPEIDKDILEKQVNYYFHLREMENIYCGYCKIELEYPTKYPHYNTPSLDHKIPQVYPDGTNTFDNILICCYQCNIVKGTMLAETYFKMLELLSVDPEMSITIQNQLFIGRLANMLERKTKKEKKGVMLSEFM